MVMTEASERLIRTLYGVGIEFMSPRVICFNDGNSAGAAETKKHFTKLQ